MNQLQSITLGWKALFGDSNTSESNELIMKSMNVMMSNWPDLPSLTLFKGGADNFWAMGKVILESNDW